MKTHTHKREQLLLPPPSWACYKCPVLCILFFSPLLATSHILSSTRLHFLLQGGARGEEGRIGVSQSKPHLQNACAEENGAAMKKQHHNTSGLLQNWQTGKCINGKSQTCRSGLLPHQMTSLYQMLTLALLFIRGSKNCHLSSSML